MANDNLFQLRTLAIFYLSHKLRRQIIIYRPFIANFVCYNMSLIYTYF